MNLHNKSTIKFIRHWILPKGFQDILIYLFQYKRMNKILVEKNDEIRNIYEGKRCFIIGNGPSLARQDLNKLKNEYTFVVNNFFISEWFDEINPFGYVVADPAFFDRSDFSIEWLTKLDQKCKNQNLFFPVSAAKTIKKYNMFQNKTVFYLEMSGTFHEDTSRFNLDLIKAVPSAQTVIIMAIIVAAHMGFKNIYLLGCDSDWAKYPSAKGYLPHFYKEKNTGTNKETCIRQDWGYENVLNAALVIFKSYRLLNKALKQKKINILNATNGGFLDVFERVDYELIFND